MPLQTEKVALSGSDRHPLTNARLLGNADPAKVITATVYVRRNPEAAALPPINSYALALPTGRRQFDGKHIPEFHGAAQEDIDAVIQFAGEYELEVAEPSLPKRNLQLRGTIGDFNRAFNVSLQRWSHPTGDYRGRSGHIHIPSNLQGIVRGVFGLDNRRLGRSYRKTSNDSVFFRSTPRLHAFLPTRLASLYNFPAEVDGTGQCIGILAFNGRIADTGESAPGGYNLPGLRSYFSDVVKVKVPEIVNVVVHGPGNIPGNDRNPNDTTGEILLDIQTAGSLAPGVKLVIYFTEFTEQGWVDAISTIVNDTTHNPSVVSISYGNAETTRDSGNVDRRGSLWTRTAISNINSAFELAAHRNITILCAAGDDGSNDAGSDGYAHVDFPASSPNVTGCGGTRVAARKGVIIRESVWNDGPGSAGGGGISDLFPLPSYQTAMRVPRSINPNRRVGRGVPDVAGLADPRTGLIIADVHGHVDPRAATGGTSATAPMWAALIARLNEALGAPVGFINPLLYNRFAAGVLRDIVAGNNGAYGAGAGWDACTGLGSPNGRRLLRALGGEQSGRARRTPASPRQRRQAAAWRHPGRAQSY
jgi:kumamolisin